ncbi:MAG: hypothetical protein HY718_01335 [Planctomycetes bacterium]|nr:hypothetical protein [Planctomycetota bacterium]
MKAVPDNSVAVVAVGGEPTASLKRMCVRHRWLCLVADEAIEVLRTVRRNRVVVVIVKVSPAQERCAELLRLLSAEASESTVIAVAACHEDDVERSVRAAGTHWYIPTADEPALIERMVAAILAEREQLPSGRATARHVRRIARVSSSSPPLLKHGRRA